MKRTQVYDCFVTFNPEGLKAYEYTQIRVGRDEPEVLERGYIDLMPISRSVP